MHFYVFYFLVNKKKAKNPKKPHNQTACLLRKLRKSYTQSST